MALPSGGGAFNTKLVQKAVTMAKILTNQLACSVGGSGVLTWKEGTNWNEVLPLTEGVSSLYIAYTLLMLARCSTEHTKVLVCLHKDLTL